MSRLNLNFIISWVDSHIIDYPTAMNLNYNWSFILFSYFFFIFYKKIILSFVEYLNQKFSFFDFYIFWVQKKVNIYAKKK